MTDSKKPDNTFRVLHTADWHLGKTLNDQSRDEEHELFLNWLLKIIGEHAVDVLVIAGDVFDSANPPQSAQSRYYDFVSLLYKNCRCSLIITAGNHDSPLQLEAPRQVLQTLGAHVVGFLPTDPESRLVVLPSSENSRLVIATIPFLRDGDLRKGYAGQDAKDIRHALIAGIKQRYEETAEAAAEWYQKGVPILATGHLTVIGTSKSDSERDIHIGGLGAVGADIFPNIFSYVALGHLHRPQRPSNRVCYSGSPIALSFSEANDNKAIQMLDFAGSTLKACRLIPVPVFRRLAQIRTSFHDLLEAISSFNPDTGTLETWVEVVVKDAGFGQDINEAVQSLVVERDFKVLKVLRESAPSDLGDEEISGDEPIEALLDNPTQIFEHRLKEETGLNAKDKQSLKIAFAQLLERYEIEGVNT